MAPSPHPSPSALLAGRRAVILGVGPGLGHDVAVCLARAGAELLVVARSPENLERTTTEVRSLDGAVTALRLDISEATSARDLVEATEEMGGVDIVIHNAVRHGATAPFAGADLSDWRATFETNLWAPLTLTQALLPGLSRRGTGSVVMISAMATRMVSSPGRAGYAISKAALNQAVRSLAYELGPRHIRVNAVVPGWMDGPTVDAWRQDPDKRHVVEEALSRIPLGQIPNTSEVAGAVLFLASDLSTAITGQCVDVNGGQWMSP